MVQNEEKLIRALWPLPGGNTRYLNTLNRVVKWVASAPTVTEENILDWLKAQYNVSEGSVLGYARVVYTLGALEVDSKTDQVVVTDLGRKILEAEGEAKARIVVERFMQDYLGFREVLTVYNRADGAIHLEEMVEHLQPYFPRWTSAAQYEYRALWLLSLGALEQDTGRHYAITEFGRTIAMQYPPLRDIDGEPAQVTAEPEPLEVQSVSGIEKDLDAVSLLAQELYEASTDSQNSQRLEQAVAEAFEFLGFSVDHLGGSGETDVLARANIGDESYTVVVDAKARSGGKVYNLNMMPLLDHRKANQAHHVVVVAGSFAGGQVESHAVAQDVVLLPVSLLEKWLRLHAQTPLNLQQHRALFMSPGLVSELPDALELAAENQAKWSQLLADLIELIHETYYEQGLLEPLPRDMMFYMLTTRLGGVRYSKQEVQQAVDLLSHPAISAMLAQEASVSLVMNRATLARTLRAFADRIETIQTETED